MFQGAEIKYQNSEDHVVRRRTSVGETADRVEALIQFFENERNEIEVENLEKILNRMTKDV